MLFADRNAGRSRHGPPPVSGHVLPVGLGAVYHCLVSQGRSIASPLHSCYSGRFLTPDLSSLLHLGEDSAPTALKPNSGR